MGRGGVGHFPKEPAVGQDAAAQTAAPLQPGFGSGADGLIHPVAWPTLFRAEQSNPLQQKLLSDECVQVGLLHDQVAAERRRFELRCGSRGAQGEEDLRGKERDLTFEARSMIEIPVAAQSAACDAFDPFNIKHRVILRRQTVPSDEIVTG